MEVRRVKNMSTILEEVKLSEIEEASITSAKAKRFLKLSQLIEEAEKEKHETYLELDDFEKHETFKVLQKRHNIPDYISVRDTAKILEVSVQMVRRYCAEEKINATQRLGSGKWLIEAKQFMDNENWEKYLQERAIIKENSLNFANKMFNILDETE
jgi:hypothetical protein